MLIGLLVAFCNFYDSAEPVLSEDIADQEPGKELRERCGMLLAGM